MGVQSGDGLRLGSELATDTKMEDHSIKLKVRPRESKVRLMHSTPMAVDSNIPGGVNMSQVTEVLGKLL